MKKQINDLKTKEVKSKCSKRAWGIFSFFSSTNVETKTVCPIAYNKQYVSNTYNLLISIAPTASGVSSKSFGYIDKALLAYVGSEDWHFRRWAYYLFYLPMC